jgi:hypothetical protein
MCRDFLQATRARICFKNNTVVFDTPEGEWTKTLGEVRKDIKNRRICTMKIPRRSELIVKIPVEGVKGREHNRENRINGRCLFGQLLIKVKNDKAITSIEYKGNGCSDRSPRSMGERV